MAPIANGLISRTPRKAGDTRGSLLSNANDRSDVIAHGDVPFVELPASKKKVSQQKRRGSRSNGSRRSVGYQMASSGSWDSSTEEDTSESLRDDVPDFFGCQPEDLPIFHPQAIDSGKEGHNDKNKQELQADFFLEKDECYSPSLIEPRGKALVDRDVNKEEPNRRQSTSSLYPDVEECTTISKNTHVSKSKAGRPLSRNEAGGLDGITRQRKSETSKTNKMKSNADTSAIPTKQNQSTESNEKSFEIIPKRDYSRPVMAPPTASNKSNESSSVHTQHFRPNNRSKDVLGSAPSMTKKSKSLRALDSNELDVSEYGEIRLKEERKSAAFAPTLKTKRSNSARALDSNERDPGGLLSSTRSKEVERANASKEALESATKSLAARLKVRTSTLVSGRVPCKDQSESKSLKKKIPAKADAGETTSNDAFDTQKPASTNRNGVLDQTATLNGIHFGSVQKQAGTDRNSKLSSARVESVELQGKSMSEDIVKSKEAEVPAASNEVLKAATTTLATRLKNRTSSVLLGRDAQSGKNGRKSFLKRNSSKSQPQTHSHAVSDIEGYAHVDQESESKAPAKVDQSASDVQSVHANLSQSPAPFPNNPEISNRSQVDFNATSDFESVNPLSMRSILAAPPSQQVRNRLLRGKGRRDKIPDFLEIPGCNMNSMSFGSATENSTETDIDDILSSREETETVRTNEIVEIVVAPLPSSRTIAGGREAFPQMSLLDRDEEPSIISARSTRTRLSFRSLGNRISRVRSLRLRGKDDASDATLSVATTGSLFRRKLRLRTDDASPGTAKKARKWFSFRRRGKSAQQQQQPQVVPPIVEPVAVEPVVPASAETSEEPTLVEEFFEAFTRCATGFECDSADARQCNGSKEPKIEESRKVFFKKREARRNYRKRRPYDSDSDDSDDDDFTGCLSR